MQQWRPHNGAQMAFHQASAFEIAYGGAAGGGKTESLIREVLRQVHIPGYKAALFRRTYPELEHSLIERAYQVYPQHGGEAREKGRIWVFKHKDGPPSKIIFAHLEHEKDVHKYQSAEFDVIGFDEATSFTEYQYTYLRSRVRGTNPDIRRYMLLATNPGNVGHTWFKTRFIDGKEPYKKYYYRTEGELDIVSTKDDVNAVSRVFIPAKIWDNPTLLKNDPGYVARLKSLDSVTRRMLLDGDWDIFAGQYFSEFRRSTHVVKPFPIPENWKRYVGIDYGLSSPTAGIFIAIDCDGNVYVYKEYYERNLTASQHAANMKRMSWRDDKPFEKVHAYFIDPSVFAKTSNGETVAEVFRREGLMVLPASNRRVDGWNSVKEYMTESNDKPKLRIFENCVNLISTLPQMIFDKYNPEDLDTTMEDHAPDALRYVIQTLRDKKSIKPTNDTEQKIIEKFRKIKKFFNPNERFPLG